ncbi:MAG: hypothetical protein MZV64_49465 [Ignavibacteriales bacterium]|nr:hypothetical protein [Ignavibacteriales bacterium]
MGSVASPTILRATAANVAGPADEFFDALLPVPALELPELRAVRDLMIDEKEIDRHPGDGLGDQRCPRP